MRPWWTCTEKGTSVRFPCLKYLPQEIFGLESTPIVAIVLTTWVYWIQGMAEYMMRS